MISFYHYKGFLLPNGDRTLLPFAIQPQVSRVNTYQRMFRLQEATCDDLATTADDVNLKLTLWNNRSGDGGLLLPLFF